METKPEIPDCVVRADALMAIVDNTVKAGINDLWYSAYYHIARFALPLVKRLRESKKCVGGVFFENPDYDISGALGNDPSDNSEEWADKAQAKQDEVYDKIIFALEMIVSDDSFEGEDAEIQEGLDLFGKYFRTLWD